MDSRCWRFSPPGDPDRDDDPAVSRLIARDLRRRYGEEQRIVRAEAPDQALDALKALKLRGESVGVLLADYRMPGMAGIDFLGAAMDLFSLARRVLSRRTQIPTPRSRRSTWSIWTTIC